jgi:hypothetical protein
MTMVAFVRFASDTAREQELLSSAAIGAFACDHAGTSSGARTACGMGRSWPGTGIRS